MKPDVTLLSSRPAVETDPQRIFTRKQRAELFALSEGRCDVCGEKITVNWTAGHIVPWSLGGKTIVENGRCECRDCARETHADDTATAAKTERIAGRKGQKYRRARNGPKLRSPKRSWPKRKFKRKDER